MNESIMPAGAADSSAKRETARAPIVLIHGLWMTPLCWEHWIAHYRARGHAVLAPAWPGFEHSVEIMREKLLAAERGDAAAREEMARLGALGVADIVDHYDRLISHMAQPPIIIGHSFGGLFAQMLLDRGLGCAGVAIAPAPVKGILRLPLSTLRVSFPALSNPWNFKRVVALTQQQFRYAFGNRLSEQESQEAYERYAVPGPDHLLFQAGLANFTPNAATSVDVQNSHRAPLLLISGGHDHIAPPSLVRANFDLYADARADTAYVEFPERAHFTLGEPGWEEVADYALHWAHHHAAGPRADQDDDDRYEGAAQADAEAEALASLVSTMPPLAPTPPRSPGTPLG